MQWRSWWLVATCVYASACSPTAPAVRPVMPPPAPVRPAAALAAWPDVARDARSEKAGARDAAVVVAVERSGTRPRLDGVRVSGEDWVRFFPNVLGVPAERVTALFDGAATGAAVSTALRGALARVAAGGRLWFVAVGYGVMGEADVASVVASAPVQVISVLDVVPEGAAGVAPPAPLNRSGGLPPITFSVASPTPLPGGARPALSYLLMGALRGWGDRDHDGRVTAEETAAYLDVTLRLLSPREGARRSAKVATELACSELTTLSVAREAAPNVVEIAPRVPPGARADAERLASALAAVQAADDQLARARAAGVVAESAVLDTPRFTREGDEWRIEVVPMPNEVAATLRVRLEQAQRLGGAAVPEAAKLLGEAGRISLVYGLLDEGKRSLTPVLEARCGADAMGYEAWQRLVGVAMRASDPKEAKRLVAMDCAYDEASASARDAVFRIVRSVTGPNDKARQLYGQAEQEADTPLARCTWSAVAEEYAKSWWSAPEQAAQVESAFNGADALRRLGRTDEAVALYRAYVEKQGRPVAGDRDANARRIYAVSACGSYLALARAEPRFFPGYLDTCKDISCAGLDSDVCARARLDPEVPLLDSAAGELEQPRRLSLAARDLEELAGWELTETARLGRLREALVQYRAAEAAWGAVVERGDATSDLAEAARQRAEAAVRGLGVALALGAEVTEGSVEGARKLARRARDLSVDERRAEPARLLVELADGLLAREQLPLTVAAAVAARDEYLSRVPATFDAGGVRYRMALEAGQLLFRSGHFAEARQRLELPYAMQCGVSAVAHEAWMVLLAMANAEADVARAQALAADGAICAIDVETRIQADRLRKPVRSIPYVLEGWKQLQASEALPNGSERRALRREAAAIFRQFIHEGPDRDEAPEAARSAAEIYAELGESAWASEMYRVFLERYAGKAGVRVAETEKAYAALAMMQARSGDYRAAARTYAEESGEKKISAKTRAAAERRARELRKDRDGRGRR